MSGKGEAGRGEGHRLPLIALTVTLVAALVGTGPPAARAGITDAADLWWDVAWPYRLPVTVGGSGVAQAAVDFTAALDLLGLNHALLDLRSLRVIPYADHNPGEPLPHAESYSTMLEDADSPQIGWHPSGVYWTVNDGSAEADTTRFSQGTGSLKATVENWPGGYGYPGVELRIAAGEPATDWSPYESLTYDVWPQVNASALDQAPDLYWFKLYNACGGSAVTQGGPPLALDRWNRAAVSLNPLDSCWPANGLDLSEITRIEFHTRDNDTVSGRSGLWDDGDVLTLWFDNLRLVDQDSGAIRWQTVPGVTQYYLYFDVLTHQGHPPAVLDEGLGSATVTGAAGSPEAGGYYHQVEGAAGLGGLQLWAAPTVEKVLRGMPTPVTTAPLRVTAARGEFEPFQLVLRSPTAASVTVQVSDLTGPGGKTIPAPTIHQVRYVTITTAGDHYDRFGPWPDPLWPLDDGASVALAASQNQPLWFTLRVPWDAAPGVYQGTVSLGGATVPYELEVWSFSLPREIHLRSEWGFGWSSIVEDVYQGYGDWDCYWEMVEAFKQDFVDHRLIPKGPGWPAGIHWGWYDCDTDTLETGTPDNPWYFTYQGSRYVLGQGFNDGYGFPAFLAFGPASNWPPDSRPYSFCGISRGTDPPGNSAYNARWADYLAALDAYLTDPAHDFSAAAYAHIVNEPQTYSDYDIVAYLARLYKSAAPHLELLLSEQVEPYIYDNAAYGPAKIDIWMPTISNYEPVKSQDRQANHGEEVWWYYLYGDDPPLPNPILMSHPGIEARITPWLAWAERVDGLLHYDTTDWSSNPWTTPNVTGQDNGDAFFFYPPRQDGADLAYCGQNGHRLVPSIRWENLRDGMEDYEYLWQLAGSDPEVGLTNPADLFVAEIVASRTLYSQVPTDLSETRAAMAAVLGGPTAGKSADPAVVLPGEGLTYTLAYTHSGVEVTLVVTDSVPAATPVVTAEGPGAVDVSGQLVTWQVPVTAGETVTLTIGATAGPTPGTVTNTAVFSSTVQLTRQAGLLIASDRLFLPLVMRGA